MKPDTYTAKLFATPTISGEFKIAGTLEGYIDLAIPGGKTLLLDTIDARRLARALNGAADDVDAHCVGDADVLLEPSE